MGLVIIFCRFVIIIVTFLADSSYDPLIAIKYVAMNGFCWHRNHALVCHQPFSSAERWVAPHTATGTLGMSEGSTVGITLGVDGLIVGRVSWHTLDREEIRVRKILEMVLV
jgi:hypothetical protein